MRKRSELAPRLWLQENKINSYSEVYQWIVNSYE